MKYRVTVNKRLKYIKVYRVTRRVAEHQLSHEDIHAHLQPDGQEKGCVVPDAMGV